MWSTLFILLSMSSPALGSPLATCANKESVRNGAFEQGPKPGSTNATYWTLSGGAIRTHLFSDATSYVIYGYPSPTISQVLQCVDVGVPYVYSANMSSSGFDGNNEPVIDAASLDGVPIKLTQAGLKFYGTATPKRRSPTLKASITVQTDQDIGGYFDNVSFKRK